MKNEKYYFRKRMDSRSPMHYVNIKFLGEDTETLAEFASHALAKAELDAIAPEDLPENASVWISTTPTYQWKRDHAS